jgi:hypothetical protein
MGKLKKCFFSQKLEIWLNPNWTWIIIGWSLTQFYFFFVSIGYPKWPPLQEKLNIGPYGENISKLFVSNQWIIWKQTWLECVFDGLLQNVCFCIDRKSMMVAIVGHIVLTFDYMGKWKNMFSQKLEI